RCSFTVKKKRSEDVVLEFQNVFNKLWDDRSCIDPDLNNTPNNDSGKSASIDELASLWSQMIDLFAIQVSNENEWQDWEQKFSELRDLVYGNIETNFSPTDARLWREIGEIKPVKYDHAYPARIDQHRILLTILNIYNQRLRKFIEDKRE
ncbi:MAG: hypothetical protein WD005_06245, partial [Haliea sp.]